MPEAPYPVEPDEHRRARHLFVLKTLTDRGFGLAQTAADHAEVQLDAPDPAPPLPDEPPTPAAPNHHQTFDRYVRIVRLLISLEHRIATGAATAATASTRRVYKQTSLTADPRRPKLHQFIQQATRQSPDRTQLRNAALDSIDAALERDSALSLSASRILEEVCQTYGLHFDIARVPDEFLDPPVPNPVRFNGTGPP